MFHILLDGCHNVELQGVKVSAPENSPNIDEIHLQSSSDVTILNFQIGTGDDCISIGPGNTNLWLENIARGPGHGISIGSLGWDMQELGVENVTLKTTTFTGTQNVMNNVENSIIVDQNYCPGRGNCPEQCSGIKISDITYQDVHGTSTTEVAVKFECSKTNPCNRITLLDVKLSYKDHPTEASCVNAGGKASGLQQPTSCLQV
ncbi:hypothetical protein HAX54_007502 [Datura stramonium]|uniref:Polygalacturonase n=1 Tax=Datura stramonium TaxID=4076 RepID=A0ABS8TD83_DATST|nr:hypothetical protein [Datura stramonium]